ncbi:hypothetical protein O7598_25015 [Micromonospora sp. WMMC241]|uniref:hypothetical protein n=1 Tax=Micromonospora sp. WMMC241 TaxID=3015159 RepID=UPI0022B6B97C|nr:hypothetical protein [Micromonospora sp. WMMC241]MCZ7439686.1 hypothetical protein [Micromonospora sp. WMMC241]
MSDVQVPPPPALTSFPLIRADDQLRIDVRLDHLTVDLVGGVHRIRPTGFTGYLVLTFPPQQAQEYAEPLAAGTPAGDRRPIFPTQSEVVLAVPPDAPPIPFTVDGILAALPGLKLVTDPLAGEVEEPAAVAAGTARSAVDLVADVLAAATGRDSGARAGLDGILAERARRAAAVTAPVPVDPDDDAAPPDARVPAAPVSADGVPATVGATALRLPSRFVLSPPGGALRLDHAAEPVERDGRVELWHTRFATRDQGGRRSARPFPIRKVGTVEVAPNADPAWRLAVGDVRINNGLNEANRKAVAEQSWDDPLTVDELTLSTLGAWLDVEGDWSSSLPVRSWSQRVVQGRDLSVRLVEAGQLYPFGHRALKVTATERRLTGVDGDAAPLQTRTVIRVLRPVKTYPVSRRTFPWRQIEILERTTPVGDAAENPLRNAANLPLPGTYLLTVGGSRYAYRCQGVDRGELVSTFELPLVFVADSVTDLAAVSQAWAADTGLTDVDLDGQALALAPPNPDPATTGPDGTVITARRLSLAPAPGNPSRAEVAILRGGVPALKRLAGAAGENLEMTYAAAFRDHGFDPAGNVGEELLHLAGPVLDLKGGLPGGLAGAALDVRGLSRRFGPVGGALGELATGQLDVREWLSDTLGDLRILGIFPLTGLLRSRFDAADLPRLVSTELDGLAAQEFSWDTTLFDEPGQELSVGPGRLGAGDDGPARLSLRMAATLDSAARRVGGSASVELRNLELTMGFGSADLVVVPIRSIRFSGVDGRKPDVDVKLGRIRFLGILAFVDTLATLVDELGFSDPPALDITSTGIRSSFSMPVPQFALGMFSIENIVLGSQLDLPFQQGAPTLSFDFATAVNPFRVSVSALAGGGFVGLTVSTGGLQRLEASLEFGASLSVNLAVARGSVSAMGGIYFRLEGSEAVLAAYLRIRGEVSVLGVLSVAVELMLALTYLPDQGKLYGRADISVKVKFFWFSKTVHVAFEQTFVGANGDPTFAELMAPTDWPAELPLPWDTYCTAFATPPGTPED